MPKFSLQLSSLVIVLLCIAALGGCGTINQAQRNLLYKLTPYRVPVVQGNVITKEQVDAIKPGMTRVDVENIMGYPLLDSPFEKSSWNYLFSIKRKNQPFKEYHVTIIFKADLVDHIDGGDVPSESEFLRDLKTKKIDIKALPHMQATDKELEKFKQNEAKKEPEKTILSVPKTSYPPLNSASH
jgi:outer membrane protein assembly factor BamE